MMERNTLRRVVSAIALGSCCVSFTNGFTPESRESRIWNDRLDIQLDVVQSSFIAETTRQKRPSIRVVDDDDDDEVDTVSLSPVLQQITDERKNFQVNLGKAMDTLRKDMPYILKETPDYSIYNENITVVDPSGVQLTGIENYKSSIKFLQQFINFWFQSESNGLQYRLVYDFARSSIRVSWHCVLIPKMPLGKPLHVDGVSMYRLGPVSGNIVEHKLENVCINSTPILPPYGVFSLLQQEWGLVGGGIPAGQIPMGV